MPTFWTDGINSPYSPHIHPAGTDFTDEICATVARIFAYVGTLALVGIVAVHLWSQYDAMKAAGPAARTGWTAGWNISGRSHPAFSVSQIDPPYKSATYTVLRHPGGGRKDILRWTDATESPAMELEVYRPGGEWDASSPASTHLAAQMKQVDPSGLEAAGILESKFGTVALLRPMARHERKDGAQACLGFFKRIDEPGLQISGWSCQGDNWPAKRAAIGCMLNRLTLLTPGNEPKLAELFARAGLKRGNCGADPSDWVTGMENPKLRGTL
jgi:hypothetical protein